jgi:hypothetical protein
MSKSTMTYTTSSLDYLFFRFDAFSMQDKP